SRVQRICRDLDLWCFNPLWYTDPELYMKELITSGFRAVITGVFAAPFSADWLGREIDREALSGLQQYVRSHRITLTGEGGEYETLVLDAPVFIKRIVIQESEKSMRTTGDSFGSDVPCWRKNDPSREPLGEARLPLTGRIRGPGSTNRFWCRAGMARGALFRNNRQ